MRFWDFALKRNLPNQNESVLQFKRVVCQSRFLATFLHFHARRLWLVLTFDLRDGANPLKDSSHMFLNGGFQNQPWDAAIESCDRWKPTVHLWYINISRSTEIQWWRCWLCPDSLSVQRMGWFFISILLLQNKHFFYSSLLCVINFRKKKSKVVSFPWFVAYKEIVSLQSYVFQEFN